MNRIDKEKNIIKVMIKIYCKKNHKSNDEICEECNELLKYAYKRLSMCRYQDEKKFCSKCPTQCYKKDMKQQMKKVMKFSGPRLIFHEPLEVIKHVFQK